MNKFVTATLIFLLHLTCCNVSVKTEVNLNKKDVLPEKITEFENLITVNPDSCKKWGLEPTNFAFEFPNNYEIEYFADGKYYVRLRKIENNILQEEITIGTFYNVYDDSSSVALLTELSKQFNSYESLGYSPQYIGIKAILDKDYPTLQAKLNYNKLGIELVEGNYQSNMIMLYPVFEGIQGANISFTRKLNESEENSNDLSKEEEDLFKGFRFIEK